MRLLIVLFPFFFLCSGMASDTYREKQMKYTRVREAYAAKEKIVNRTLAGFSISRDNLRIYLRAFKTEKKVELWAKNSCDSIYTMIKEFTICDLSV